MPPQENTQRKSPTNSAISATQSVNIGTKTSSFGNLRKEEPLLAKKDISVGSVPVIENEKGVPMRGLLTIKNTEVKIKLEPDSFIRIDSERVGFSNPFTAKKEHHPQLEFILPSDSGSYVVEKTTEYWAGRQDIYILRDTTNNSIVSGAISKNHVDGEPPIIGITPKGEEVTLNYAEPKIADSYSNNGPHDSRFVHQSSFQPVRPKVDFSNLVVPKRQAEQNP